MGTTVALVKYVQILKKFVFKSVNSNYKKQTVKEGEIIMRTWKKIIISAMAALGIACFAGGTPALPKISSDIVTQILRN